MDVQYAELMTRDGRFKIGRRFVEGFVGLNYVVHLSPRFPVSVYGIHFRGQGIRPVCVRRVLITSPSVGIGQKPSFSLLIDLD